MHWILFNLQTTYSYYSRLMRSLLLNRAFTLSSTNPIQAQNLKSSCDLHSLLCQHLSFAALCQNLFFWFHKNKQTKTDNSKIAIIPFH